MRLLRFIARFLACRKEYAFARNRHLHPRLRRALIKLENGISDVSTEEIYSIIMEKLQSRIDAHAIKVELLYSSLKPASAQWWPRPGRIPLRGGVERGVFKVRKRTFPTAM